MDERIVLQGGTLIDGTGSKPVEDSVIVIEGQRIVGVGKSGEAKISHQSKILDISGKVVMPGLIDAHIHFSGSRSHDRDVNLFESEGLRLLRAANDARALLDAGFTTCKDMGGANGVPLRDAVTEGLIRGPRILAARYNLSPTFGHGDRQDLSAKLVREINPGICDGVGECRKAVRLAFRAGANFVKVSATGGVGAGPRDSGHRPGHTVEELKAIVDEANKFGSYVSSHTQGVTGIKNAIVAGVKTIEHGDFMDEECCRMMIERSSILTTTLSIVHQFTDPKARDYGLSSWQIQANVDKVVEYTENVRMAHDMGVVIAAGTDFSGPPLLQMGRNAMELELYVDKCGFDPMDAVVSATMNGAKACCLEKEIGTIQVGKRADILVVDGDPLKDIGVLQSKGRISLVMKDGVIENSHGL